MNRETFIKLITDNIGNENWQQYSKEVSEIYSDYIFFPISTMNRETFRKLITDNIGNENWQQYSKEISEIYSDYIFFSISTPDCDFLAMLSRLLYENCLNAPPIQVSLLRDFIMTLCSKVPGSYALIMLNFFTMIYYDKRFDIILNHWLWDDLRSFDPPKDLSQCMYFMSSLVSHHQTLSDFNSKHSAWAYIHHLCKHNDEYKCINYVELYKLCAEHNVPNIMEHFTSLFRIVNLNLPTNKDLIDALEMMLEQNLQPTMGLVEYAIIERELRLLKLFVKYGIDIKSILAQRQAQNDPVLLEVETELLKLNISLKDILGMWLH